ncbi:MAG: hypothetical protein OYH76_24745 [Defluviicoccus sp.]|nr:hypothetical protein [Defluviicoccus sp.]MDE0279117.1 hypothetical protein [Defluviicoccus sp.]
MSLIVAEGTTGERIGWLSVTCSARLSLETAGIMPISSRLTTFRAA